MGKLAIWTQDRIDGYSLCVCGKPSSMFVSDVSVGADTSIQNAEMFVNLPPSSVSCRVEKVGVNDFTVTVPKEFEGEVQYSWKRGKKGHVSADVYEDGVFIGRQTADVYCVIDTAVYKPIISDITVTKGKMLDGKLLNGHSTVSVSVKVDTSQLLGASISTVEVTLGTQRLNATKLLFSSNYLATFTVNSTGSFTPSIVVTDSRGTKAYGKGTLVSVVGYSFPQISLILVQRSLENGNIDDNGLYIAMTAKFDFSTVGSSNSIVATRVFVKQKAEEKYTISCESFENNTPVVFGGTFSVDKGYDIKVVITDKAGNSSTYVDYITSGAVGLELYRNQAASFGKPVETLDGLELAKKWKFYTHEDVFHDKNVTVGKDLLVGGNITIVGKIIEKSPDVYQVPAGAWNSSEIFSVTGMTNGDFVSIDFLAFTVSSFPIISPVVMVICYSNSNADVNIYLPNESVDMWDMHISFSRITGGVKVNFDRTEGSKAICRINHVTTSNKNTVIKYAGTKI